MGGASSYYWKIIYFNRVVKNKGMFSNITKGRIRKGHASSRGYPFMFTNPTYEMLSFTNICRLTLTIRIFINNIGRHHKWDLIFKGEQRAYSVCINKNTPWINLGEILINNVQQLFLTMVTRIANIGKSHENG